MSGCIVEGRSRIGIELRFKNRVWMTFTYPYQPDDLRDIIDALRRLLGAGEAGAKGSAVPEAPGPKDPEPVQESLPLANADGKG
jgi:hypothetical protein